MLLTDVNKQKYNKKSNLKSTFVLFALTNELYIFHLMKINFTKIFTIIALSSVLGLIYNLINPSGLRLLSRDKELNWVTDSILTSRNKLKDTLNIKEPAKSDSFNKMNENRKTDNGKIVHKEKNTSVIKDENEDTGFGEPLLINLKQAYKLYQMDVMFIDARDKADYTSGHIKNSLSLPFNDFDLYKTILTKIPKSQTLISYCGGADCQLSKGLANRLFSLGYHNIYVFFGGWGQWKSSGYPIE
jgi:rhodanese-related sulfurtransferase